MNTTDPYCFGFNISTTSPDLRRGSRAAATSKIERLVIIVNGSKPLTIITKRFILDVAADLDPPLDLTLRVPTFTLETHNKSKNLLSRQCIRWMTI